MENDKKDYYVGLDIGTDSDGWAVTTDRYDIIKAHGQKLWGARLFDRAEVAAKRRLKRGARRRWARKKLETRWLQEIFANEISVVDKNFFVRLNNSSLFMEDKDSALHSKDSLFFGTNNGREYSDKDYYKQYKTIYHLRKELLEKPAQDIRLLYLAIYSILKSRGHFVTGTDFSDGNVDNLGLARQFNEMLECAQFASNDNIFKDYVLKNQVSNEQIDSLLNVIKTGKGLRDCKEKFAQTLKIEKSNKKMMYISDSLASGVLNVLALFDLQATEENKALSKVDFADADYDDKFLGLLSNNLSQESQGVVEKIKNLYSVFQLKKLLGNHNYLCEAMIEKFDKHKEQLAKFKAFIKKYYPKQYYDIFRNATFGKKNQCNYAQYVNVDKIGGKKLVLGLTDGGKLSEISRTRMGFYAFVKSILNQKPENPDEDFEKEKQNILDKIETNDFLPKQRTIDNAVIPNSLMLKEAKQILDINKQKFAFLSQKDENGLDNAQKILDILKFRVPYYVGPLFGNENHNSKNAWRVMTNENERLYPWNFDKLVDKNASEEQFILRMTNKCSYLHKFDVLPKASILYQKYLCLNELNNLKVNGKKLPIDLKQKIFDEVYSKSKNGNVKTRDIKDYLIQTGTFAKEDEIEISGLPASGKLEQNYSSYVTFKNKFGDNFDIDIAEEYIKLCTVLSDKDRIIEKIHKDFPQIPDDKLRDMKQMNFSQKWGELSKEFLCGKKSDELVFFDKETGEQTNLLNVLYDTQENMMQIINDSKYIMQFDGKQMSISDGINHLNKDEKTELEYEDVENLYCSPAVKRATWQTVKVLKEIIFTMKKYRPDFKEYPKKIFVEVTRDDDGTVQKEKRAEQIKKLYGSDEAKKSFENAGIDLAELTKQLNKQAETKLAFRSDKLYLYFMQAGRSAYTGEKIDLNDLYNENLYDIDHIIPQSLVKDDSLDNRVLVCKECNEEKGDSDIVPIQYQNRMKSMWSSWKNAGLMSQQKYDRLTRTEPFSEQDLNGFIQRQLVETNQANKAVIELLKNYFGDKTQIVYSKASLVSEFRKRYDIVKCRAINDFHHAKDAYLNIVVGNGFNSKFSSDYQNYIKGYKKIDEMFTNSKDAVEKGIKFYYSTIKDNSQINSIKANIVSSQKIKISGMSESITEIKTNDNKTFYTFDNQTFYSRHLNFRTKIFDSKIYDYASQKEIWDPKIDLQKVYDNCYRNDCLVTKMSFTNENSAFYDETLYKSKIHQLSTNAKISQKLKGKLSDIEKYGGYNNEKVAYFMIVDSEDKKGKTMRTIESVTSLMFKQCHGDSQKIFEMICQTNNLKNAKCIVEKVNKKTTIGLDGGKFLLASKMESRYELHNMNEFRADKFVQKYVKILAKYQEIQKNYQKTEKKDDGDETSKEITTAKKLFDALNKYNYCEDLHAFEQLDDVILSPSPSKDKQKSLRICKVDNQKLYDSLLEKLMTKTYHVLSTVREKMSNGREIFANLSVFDQADTLLEILKLFACNDGVANLTKIGGSRQSGKLRINKDITDKHIKLIFESPTGIYKKVINL